MKKIIFALLVFALMGSLCFAQSSTTYKVEATSESNEGQTFVKVFKGKVESVSFGDAIRGISTEITVADDKGQRLNFVVLRLETTITDKDGSTITLDEIKKDDNVVIKYRIIKGRKLSKMAQSIKVVEVEEEKK
jgi:hypothetical protein